MHILATILLVLAGIIVLLLVIGLFMRKKHYVRREVIINAPRRQVFDYLKLLKNQDEFNKHAMAGAERKREYKGTDGTVGYIYAWSGDKNAGVGEKEIKGIIDGKKIEMEIRFEKPMRARATIIMEMESLADDQTRLYWSNGGVLKYPLNIMIPIMEKHVVKDMDTSLSALKNILEKQSQHPGQ